MSQWRPDAVLCELGSEKHSRKLLQQIQSRLPGVPVFSFLAEKKARAAAASRRIGFLAHLEEEINDAELRLHIEYGRKALQFEEQLCALAGQYQEAFEAATIINSSLDHSQIIESTFKRLRRLVKADSWSLFLNDYDHGQTQMPKSADGPVRAPTSTLEMGGEGSLIARAARQRRAVVINEIEGETIGDFRYRDGSVQAVMCLPMIACGETVGVLEATINAGSSGRFEAKEVELASNIAGLLATALSNATHYANVEHLCLIDDLTRLYNLRFLHRSLESEVKRGRRYNTPVAVIFLDLDGFKNVNDLYGHLTGSATLVEAAYVIHNLVRETDFVARYGGDEFVIVLPETTAEQAMAIAERIRSYIEKYSFGASRGYEIYLTASFGVAAFPDHGQTPQELIQQADRAMYKAKESNKNCVALARVD